MSKQSLLGSPLARLTIDGPVGLIQPGATLRAKSKGPTEAMSRRWCPGPALKEQLSRRALSGDGAWGQGTPAPAFSDQGPAHPRVSSEITLQTRQINTLKGLYQADLDTRSTLPAALSHTFISWTAIVAGSFKGRARETEAVRPEVDETSSKGARGRGHLTEATPQWPVALLELGPSLQPDAHLMGS